MAEISPIDIQKHLGGIDYPTSKDDLIEQARASDAEDEVMARLESLPDRTFESPAEVMKELGGSF